MRPGVRKEAGRGRVGVDFCRAQVQATYCHPRLAEAGRRIPASWVNVGSCGEHATPNRA